MRDNVPNPPTWDEIVSTLAITHDALRLLVPKSDTDDVVKQDGRAAMGAAADVLRRIGERNIPRP